MLGSVPITLSGSRQGGGEEAGNGVWEQSGGDASQRDTQIHRLGWREEGTSLFLDSDRKGVHRPKLSPGLALPLLRVATA